MKKQITAILLGTTVFALTACGASGAGSNTSAAASTTSAEEAVTETAIVGGWSTEDSEEITDEIRALVEKATQDKLGATYNPVAYLGHQIVNGTNHRILCEITTVTANPETKLAVVTIYEDLQGNAEVTDIDEEAAKQ